MKRQRLFGSRLLALSLLASGAAQLCAQAGDVEIRAMRDEMQRSMKELHLQEAERPYYISYKIVDTDRKEAQATFGSLVSSSETRSRFLSVSVRVGSYDFDNSNFTGTGSSPLSALLAAFGSGLNVLPIDDNYDELRRKIWLATDTAYKKAVEDLSGKKAAEQNRNRGESVPDFSKAPARQETEILPEVKASLPDAERLVRATSATFRSLPSVESSTAQLEILNSTERFLNSEGTSYVRVVPEVYFHATASLQNKTGEIFSDSYSTYGRSLADLPSEPALVQEVQTVSDRLSARRNGKVAKRYNGPVLVEGQGAAELFAHHFADLLSAHAHSSGNGGSVLAVLLGGGGGGQASLLNKVGSRVLPEFLTLVDNPQLTQADGHPLLGNYKFDEEGTPSQETVLVKDGVLKTLLTSRTPSRGLLQSTGNMRERGVLPGNLFVNATKSSAEEDLKTQMIALLKTRGLEFGFIIRRLSGNAAVECSRVYPDGHEEPVRDARVAEISAASFKDILAVSKERTVFTERGASTSLANFSPFAADDFVTYVVPDLLFEDMSIEHVPNGSPKLPVLPSPLASSD